MADSFTSLTRRRERACKDRQSFASLLSPSCWLGKFGGKFSRSFQIFDRPFHCRVSLFHNWKEETGKNSISTWIHWKLIKINDQNSVPYLGSYRCRCTQRRPRRFFQFNEARAPSFWKSHSELDDGLERLIIKKFPFFILYSVHVRGWIQAFCLAEKLGRNSTFLATFFHGNQLATPPLSRIIAHSHLSQVSLSLSSYRDNRARLREERKV